MAHNSFVRAVTIYEASHATRITRHRVEHVTLGNFCVKLNHLLSELGDLSHEEYWRIFLAPLKRLRFALCAAPIKEGYREDRIATDLVPLRQHIKFCHEIYPHFAEKSLIVLDALEELLHVAGDPLLEAMLALTPSDQDVAWVIKESRLIPHVEEVRSGLHLPLLHVIHPLQLKDLKCYDRVLVIGPARWFPDSIFTASRTKQVDILIFDWIIDNWKPQNVFVDPYKSSGRSYTEQIAVTEKGTFGPWDGFNPLDLLIVTDPDYSMITTLRTGNGDEYENIDALCAFLEGDRAIFVDASEGAKILVIDPDEDADNRIVHVRAKDLEPGLFVLVRTGGGGDYIIPIADRIMGGSAQEARRRQRDWKDRLRGHASAHGLTETSIELLDFGSGIANETNLRNWMSPKSIRPHSKADFLAIMKLIDLAHKAETYWDTMTIINKAHHKAGFDIRDVLLKQVRDINMEELQKQGSMDFKISEDDESGLTAFRIERVLKDIVSVPYSRIGQPLRIGDQLWRE